MTQPCGSASPWAKLEGHGARVVARARGIWTIMRNCRGIRRGSHVRLMDTPGFYKAAMKRLIRAREHALDREIDVAPVPDDVGNYALLDLSDLSAKPFGKGFAEWLFKTVLPRESLFELTLSPGATSLSRRSLRWRPDISAVLQAVTQPKFDPLFDLSRPSRAPWRVRLSVSSRSRSAPRLAHPSRRSARPLLRAGHPVPA